MVMAVNLMNPGPAVERRSLTYGIAGSLGANARIWEKSPDPLKMLAFRNAVWFLKRGGFFHGSSTTGIL
jgi:hypothetical protein